MSKGKLPISAIVVGLNEGHLLADCLNSISFCSEVLYYDLGSKDDSISIAKKLDAEIRPYQPIPFVEMLHAKEVNHTRNDWVLIIDPDERITSSLGAKIIDLFQNESIDQSIGAITASIQYYFKKRPLSGTPWGAITEELV